MSSLLDETLQQALSTAQWASTPDLGHILKYTRHPSRPGYILLLTDLSRVYVEVLTAASVPSRLVGVKKKAGKRGPKGKKRSGANGSDDDDDGDVVKSSERALKRLGEAMADLRDATVEVKDHDYHDKVVYLEADQCDWIFHMTELKGREALDVLADQLITPMAALLAGAHGTTVESHVTPINAVARLFIDTDIATSMVASASDSGKARARVSAPRGHHAPRAAGSPEQDGDSAEEYKSPSPVKHSKRRSPPKTRLSPSPTPSDPESDGEEHNVERDRPARKNTHKTYRKVKQAEPDDSDAEPARRQSASASPPRPAPSQQSKREREEAEEEELEKRMEQMKKKMSSGGGGGRLSKRRGGRFG